MNIRNTQAGQAPGLQDMLRGVGELEQLSGVQFMFAKVQLDHSLRCKEQAEAKMQILQDKQAAQRDSSNMANRFREMQEIVRKGGRVEVPADMKAWMDTHNLKIGATRSFFARLSESIYKALEGLLPKPLVDQFREFDLTGKMDLFLAQLLTLIATRGDKEWSDWARHFEEITFCDMVDKDQIEMNLKNLADYREVVGSDNQNLIVLIQSYIGQYNSYMQGAMSAIAQANQANTNVVRGQ